MSIWHSYICRCGWLLGSLRYYLAQVELSSFILRAGDLTALVQGQACRPIQLKQAQSQQLHSPEHHASSNSSHTSAMSASGTNTEWRACRAAVSACRA